jgi:hypothetical protein
MNVIAHLFGHLFRCRDISHLVSQMQDRELTPAERRKVRWHIGVCNACMRFEKQIRLISEARRRYRQ